MAEHYIALDHSFVPILFFFPWMPNPHRSKCVKAREHFKKLFSEVRSAAICRDLPRSAAISRDLVRSPLISRDLP